MASQISLKRQRSASGKNLIEKYFSQIILGFTKKFLTFERES